MKLKKKVCVVKPFKCIIVFVRESFRYYNKPYFTQNTSFWWKILTIPDVVSNTIDYLDFTFIQKGILRRQGTPIS